MASTDSKPANVDAAIKEADVVVFVREGCPYCAKAEADLKKNGIEYQTFNINDFKEELVARTGVTSAPSTWIKGTYVGGCNDGPEPGMGVVPMLASGKFQELAGQKGGATEMAGSEVAAPAGGVSRNPDDYELPTVPKSNQIGPRIGDVSLPDEEFKAKLTTAQYNVLRHKHTEPKGAGVFPNGFDDHFEPGVYLCGSCYAAGLEVPLYTSSMKYACGCGWPGFWTNVKDAIYEKTDEDGYRVEIMCARCDGHMGHVFRGEGQGNITDERHCVNGCSIIFAPIDGSPIQIPKYSGRTFGH